MLKLKKNRIFVAAAIATVAGVLGLIAWGILSEEPATAPGGVVVVRGSAPDFTLSLLDGGEFTLREHFGKPIVISWWDPG